MSIWYALCEATHLEFLHMTFMKNALLAVLILAPLFGLLSTMIVTGRMAQWVMQSKEAKEEK